MALENHQDEGNQDGNDSIDKVHLEGQHIRLEEKGKKRDIIVKKIDAINVARKDTLLETVNPLKWKVI